ncbi:MAG: hypothetical protein CO150_02190 [Nitrospirae bacterium CG_4_9_14_3_um_filter_53_35]|nr:MAG: hypothetical protein CO150_02190 [Nitrospirae bacterium CG_4_9_14_3_um_filter_53_35]
MNKIMYRTALTASLMIGAQVMMILLRGESACLNQGCKVVEGLMTLSPLLFNLAGLVYFQLLFWILFRTRFRPQAAMEWISILLLAGLSVEGVLLSYQIFVARAFCSYCILLFLMVLLMNALAGRQQLFKGAAVVVAVISIFSLLSFGPSMVLSRYQSLDSGTFAVKTCSSPVKKLYLIFSSECPHCRNVIKALENCNSCDFHFNPVDRIKTLDLPDLERRASYSAEFNRLVLSLMGIKEVPVVIAKNPDGFSIIKGETNIIQYIEEACFQKAPLSYINPSWSPGQEETRSSEDENGLCGEGSECH